ncbi:hypothetical protein G4B88_012437 [Cannabis sativa]|uniref:Uncharacterized protein n=1 Tax=Cannabis sativa TaxID=3483 RepID=A0A7J6I4X6_CANSA|nr:hypothetical protein G4B88_012437 [Cannabis sativa]
MRKVVGDGQSVDAFRDPWIPRPRYFRPISPAPIDGVMVSELIGSEGAWDVQTLSQYFLSLDIDVLDVLAREAWEEFCGVGVSSGGCVLGASAGGVGGRGVGGSGDGAVVDRRGNGGPRGGERRIELQVRRMGNMSHVIELIM